TIDETAERLRGLLPGARFAVAHGQMEERHLEERMLQFLRGDADVLVCTSIIESGIDIPQANTLIVDRADHFGLAQLYPIPVRLDVNVDAYVPADYVPYEQAKVDIHRRVAAARDVGMLEELRAELEDRFGPVPEPLSNLILLQQARIKLGQAGAQAVSFRQG